MPPQLRLIKSDEPRARFRADARLRLWGAAMCAGAAVALTAAGYAGWLKPLLAGPSSAAALLWAAYLAVTFVGQRSQRFALTASRLEIERGMPARRYENVELWRIREVFLEQTLLERLRGAGRIKLVPSDGTPIMLGPIADARALYDKLAAATKPPPRLSESR